ncbi:MAG: hypothetical protein V4475_08540 [Pseudomonadota bacterium]
MRQVSGETLTLRCSSCLRTFSTFVFSGDTDMATNGLEAATSFEPPSVALGELTADEWREGYDAGRALFEKRISREHGAKFVALSVKRWIEGSSGDGLSFQEFQKIYEPASPVYCCPLCGGEAPVISRLTPAEFLGTGGQLIIAGNLILN